MAWAGGVLAAAVEGTAPAPEISAVLDLVADRDRWSDGRQVFGVEAAGRIRAPKATEGRPGLAMRAIAPPFRWFNRVYTQLARLDALVMPRAFAAIILMRGEKR